MVKCLKMSLITELSGGAQTKRSFPLTVKKAVVNFK